MWSPRHTMASGSHTHASAATRCQPGGFTPLLFQICLPQVDLDAGVNPQLAAKDVKYRHDNVWVAGNVQIVQERHQPFIRSQLPLNGHQSAVLSEAGQSWQESVPLFASFTLVNFMDA